MKDNLTHSDRYHPSIQSCSNKFEYKLLGLFGAIVCGFSVTLLSSPAVAQTQSPFFVVRTEQGETLRCRPPTLAHPTSNSLLASSVICERPPVSSSQPLDGATDMLLKLIYLGLPGVVLVGISLRTLHLHRQLMRQRAFVESLERIWERTVSY